MLDWLKPFCSGATVGRAVSKTMAGLVHAPYFDSDLKFYPESSGGKTIKELLK